MRSEPYLPFSANWEHRALTPFFEAIWNGKVS